MNKRIKAVLTAVLVTASALPMIPSAAEAADDEYLVRDKWGYCKSANYVESDHFVIFYGNNDTTGHVNAEFLRRNLEDYEKLWKCYSEYLGMENMNVDVNGRSSQKYKTNVYLTCTGLPEFQEGWAF
ncbi:MAG TPA: N-acetylglucosamine-1-phosphate uridyltransferase, partial [Ruminococcus flavefaciens]|nr:N-acetylglucosamine-1-phosphate uridyltransferase [Ruminococcus flavefaciens]